MKIKNVNIDTRLIKAGPEDGLKEGQFIVYPSTFVRQPDSYGDIVAPGAFLEDIDAWKARGEVLPGLWGHRMDDPDYYVAGALDEGEDVHGWWVKGEFDLENPKARQVYRLCKGRRVNQLSFAYDVLDEGRVELADGTIVNELRKLRRYEFSFVPVGANQTTSIVAVKAMAESLKAAPGRVLPSTENVIALKQARDAIDSVLASAMNRDDAQGEASGTSETKSEDRDSGKLEESKMDPSVKARATLALLSLCD